MRQIIINIVLGICVIAFGIFGFNKLSDMKKVRPDFVRDNTTNVFVESVQLKSEAISYSSNGTLEAKNKIDITPKVQGIFEKSRRSFRDGVKFRKGELLVQIDNKDILATLRSQKSQFQQALVNMLPDLKFDYPNSFEKWNSYAASFEVEGDLMNLPDVESDREKAFVTLKNVYTQYYSIRATESNLRHYRIYAPFSGILSDVNVNPGTLVGPGQKLGELIDPSVFEIELKIPSALSDLMVIGKEVVLNDLYSERQWTGSVKRLQAKVDQSSQSVLVIIEVKATDLRAGMFLQATISTEELNDVYEVKRNLLVNGNQIFSLQDSILRLKNIEVVHFKENTVLLKGLENGELILNNIVPGSFDGMKVNILSE